MKIEDLVPPLELCKKIPAGKFADSALVWTYSCDKTITDPTVERREDVDFCRRNVVNAPPVYPSPTMAEILIAEPKIAGIFRYDPDKKLQKVIWVAEYLSEKCGPVWIHDETPATAALKLWMELNKEEKEK